MKKIVSVSIVLLVLTSTNVFAQTKTGKKAYRHYSTVSVGHGFINVWKTFLDKVIDIPEYKVKSTFFYTLIYEYNFGRFSGGFSGSYSRVNGRADRFELSDQISIVSVLMRGNYHFIKSAKKLDPYFGGGIGFNNAKYKNLNTQTVIPDLNKHVPSELDFCGQLGLKYFPVKHVGVYMEAGYVGGAILHVGITGKF